MNSTGMFYMVVSLGGVIGFSFWIGFYVGKSTSDSAAGLPLRDESFGTALQRQMLKNWIERGSDG